MNYLNERHGLAININAVFFSYARLKDGQEVIARTVLVPDETQKVRAGRRTTSVAELLDISEQRRTSDMVKICRQAAGFLREQAAGTYGKSFRYWAKGPQGNRMVFGVNVSGERLNGVAGQPRCLDTVHGLVRSGWNDRRVDPGCDQSTAPCAAFHGF